MGDDYQPPQQWVEIMWRTALQSVALLGTLSNRLNEYRTADPASRDSAAAAVVEACEAIRGELSFLDYTGAEQAAEGFSAELLDRLDEFVRSQPASILSALWPLMRPALSLAEAITPEETEQRLAALAGVWEGQLGQIAAENARMRGRPTEGEG